MSEPYATGAGFRTALEHRLKERAATESITLDRVRRRVTVERMLARLERVQPGRWVLKGGMALEARLGGEARSTKDLDLGLRMAPPDAAAAAEMLTEALAVDLDDHFTYELTNLVDLKIDGAGDICRASVRCRVAGKLWGAIKVDIGVRSYELDDVEPVRLPGSLQFAAIEPPRIEAISIPRHVAEKFHGMLKEFNEQENSRTRDLVDIVLLRDLGLIDIAATSRAVRQVFAERQTELPDPLPLLPSSWEERYATLATEHGITPATFDQAELVARSLWAQIIATEET